MTLPMQRIKKVQSPRGAVVHLSNVGPVTLCGVPTTKEWRSTAGKVGLCSICKLRHGMLTGSRT